MTLSTAAPASTPAEPVRRIPVTPMQRRLLLQHLMFPQDGAFNLAYAFRLDGDLDLPRLRRCVDLLLSGCTALNTTFADDERGLAAVLHDGGAGLAVTDLPPGLEADAEQRTVTGWLAARADSPMPPDVWPLYDVRIHRGTAANYLTVLSSHLISDAYTWYNVIEKAAQLYRDPSAWHRISQDIGLHPAAVAGPPAEPHPAAVAALREMLAGRAALGHQALAVDRTEHPVLPGISRSAPIPSRTTDRLRAGLIGRHGPFATFLAGYAVALGRLTASSQVVVGVPLGNRRTASARRAFGYFVNTLPLPIDLEVHETFEDLVHWVAARVFTLLRHQDFDLTAHAASVLDRVPSGPVATDNAFTFYKQALRPDFDGCPAEPLPIPRALIKYPFGMTVEDRGPDGYLVTVEHLSRLTPADPLAGVLHLLDRVAEAPATPLAALGLLDPARSAEVARLGGQARHYPIPDSLDEWFRNVVAEHAGRTAVSDPDGELTYAELDRQVDLVAGALDRCGAGPTVAVAMGRGRRLIAVILGVLRSGRSYLPIDPAAPAERVRHIVAQFPDLLLVADPDALPELATAGRVTPDQLSTGDPGAVGGAAGGPPASVADSRDEIAYTIFTSGSTGVPKGVEVTHGNVMRLFRSAEDHFDFGPSDTWCLFHSYAFDFSVWEIFGALLYGGRLVVVPDLTARSPDAFLDLLERERVTVLNQTPSAFRRLTGVLRPDTRLAVRWVVFGGEALHFEVLRPWLRAGVADARLVNMYGITETTVHVTFFEVQPDLVGQERASVIGRPLGDLQVSVVDRGLNRCPVGVPGELLVGGAGLARGYRNRPDLTDQRFLRGTPYGEVVYRTGDQGCLRPDGTLVYLGRIDKQVQLRGYRIELGEVEAALLAVPGVRECAVLLDEPDGVEPRLVAYLADDGSGGAPADGEIRGQLARRLPPYMTPAMFVRVPAIPLTVNGKVAEHLLPRPAAAAAPDQAPGERDCDDLALAVARIWSEIVQAGHVGVDDNFFDIGGTSMHVAAVHRRLVTELDAGALAMVELFECPTPRTLADRVRRHTPGTGRPDADHPRHRPDTRSEPRPAPRRAGRAGPARRGTLRPVNRKDLSQ